MKKYNKFELLTRDYKLTELCLSKNTSSKNSSPIKYAIYSVVCSFLKDYGVYLFGKSNLLDLNNVITDVEMLHCKLDDNFPIENEEILKQMYGYKNSLINITLSISDECEYSFYYNTSDYSCNLCKMVLFTTEISKHFDTFTEMFKYYKSKNFKNNFELEK